MYPPEIGGPATYVKTMEAELPKHGVEVSVVSFHTVRHLSKGVAHLAYTWKLFWAAYNVDVIVALDPVSVGFPATLVSFIRAKPLVVKIVGDYAWEQGCQRYGIDVTLDKFVEIPNSQLRREVATLRRVELFVAQHANAVIVPSMYLQSIVAAWGIPREKITVVANAFPSIGELPEKALIRKELGLSGTVLFSAGRLVPWKGFATLITLFSELKKQFPDATLFIAGSGPLEERLHKIIVAMNLSESVHLLGSVDHQLLMKYIRAADCFVLNTGYEGLSHQLLEVLAVGTPIVTTDVGGNPELITHEHTGLMVEYDDGEAIQRAISRILRDPALALSLSKNGKAFVAQFTIGAMVEGTRQVLTAVTRP